MVNMMATRVKNVKQRQMHVENHLSKSQNNASQKKLERKQWDISIDHRLLVLSLKTEINRNQIQIH